MSIILRPYQSQIISEARDLMSQGLRSLLICSPTGCISGDALIRVNRAGKGYQTTLAKEFAAQKLPNRRDDIPTRVRALKLDQSGVALAECHGVVYSGARPCIILKSKTRQIKLTQDHLVFSDGSWVRADQMLGKRWAIDTPKAVKRAARQYRKVRDSYMTNIPFHPYAVAVNSTRDGRYKKIELHRAIYEAHRNGYTLEQYREILRTNESVSATLWYMDPSTHEIHHINGNHYDNRPDNLSVLTIEEHKKIHACDNYAKLGQGQIVWETVDAIEDGGVCDTYDVVGSETGSFTANDIVVHNSGKTALTAAMLKSAAEKNKRSIFIVHRRELIKQSVLAFDSAGVSFGIIANGFAEQPEPLVQIASVLSLASRLRRAKAPDLIVWDECHHLGASSWKHIYNSFPNAFHIGLTATPARTDGQGLGDFFQKIIHGPAVTDLISQGYLCPFRIFAPSSPDLSKTHLSMGDFMKSEIADAMNKPTITGSAITEYKRHAMGKRNVVFCVSIEHARAVSDQFNLAGIPARQVDSTCDFAHRDESIRMLADGKLKVLTNCDLFGEGFDLPNIDVVTLLRPTMSLGLHLQQIGRVLRPAPGKSEALILDHASNTERHGFPDEIRDWSLDGIPKKSKQDKSPSVRVCPVCFAAQFSGLAVCKQCDTPFKPQPREVKEADGDLSELTREQINLKRERRARKFEQHQQQTMEDLIELGKKRGYKHPYRWAHAVHQSRQRKKLGI